ncbi:MAG: hypothetical protein V9G29_18285 [Burkholderiaceae bacterium]
MFFSGPLGDRQRIARSAKTAAIAVSLAAARWEPGVVRPRISHQGSIAERTNLAICQLPAEVRQSDRLFIPGGSVTHKRGGTVFSNRGRPLPGHARGHIARKPSAHVRLAAPEARFYSGDPCASLGRFAQ